MGTISISSVSMVYPFACHPQHTPQYLESAVSLTHISLLGLHLCSCDVQSTTRDGMIS